MKRAEAALIRIQLRTAVIDYLDAMLDEEVLRATLVAAMRCISSDATINKVLTKLQDERLIDLRCHSDGHLLYVINRRFAARQFAALKARLAQTNCPMGWNVAVLGCHA